MQQLHLVIGWLWMIWTVVGTLSAQHPSYRAWMPRYRAPRPFFKPAWNPPINQHFPPPQKPLVIRHNPIHHDPPTAIQHYQARPVLPVQHINPQPRPHHIPFNFNHFRNIPPQPLFHPEHVPPVVHPPPPFPVIPFHPPSHPVPQRHIYWYRPEQQHSPISNPFPQAMPQHPFVQQAPMTLLDNPQVFPQPPSPPVQYQNMVARIPRSRIFTSPSFKSARSIYIPPPVESSWNSYGYMSSGNGLEDEIPREEETTLQTDLDTAESLANSSSRQPRYYNHDDEDVGECGEESSCRTSYHCAILGGRPTFVPCGMLSSFYCCDLTVASITDSSKNSTVKSDPQCGWSREKTSRVVGGNDADFGEMPWQVFIKVGEAVCGGSLLDRRHVVTAAHCVKEKNLDKILVLLGELVLKHMVEELPHEARRVAQIIVHPDYEDLNIDAYDVAILVLDRPVHYQPHIMPICLPEPDEDVSGAMATVSGWGRFFANREVRAIHLQSVQVPIIENTLCKKWLRSRGKYASINSDHVCAGYESGGHDSCRGDSGGPLTYQKNDGRWYLVGIVSAGYGCGKPRQPGIYHRVSKTAEWISSMVFS